MNIHTDGIDQLILETLGPSRGRRAMPVQARVVRELTSADIARLAAMPEGALSTARPLQKLRHSHHMLARLVAQGVAEGEMSLVTGYSLSYISNIKHDPAFKGLVSYYESQVKEIFLDVHQRLAVLGLDSVDELQDRLANNPDGFTQRELMELAALGLDRAGYGPHSTVTNAPGGLLDANLLAQIKKEIAGRQSGTIRTLAPSDSGAHVGGVIDNEPLAKGASQGSPSQGDDLPEQSRPGTSETVR